MPDTTLPLQHARTLHHSAEGGQDLIEIHSPDGVVELRIRLTPEGPVLQMESVRLQLKAAESIDVESRSFSVRTTDSIDLHSDSTMHLTGQADIQVNAQGEVVVKGEKIFLN
jgi:hypothetical protein